MCELNIEYKKVNEASIFQHSLEYIADRQETVLAYDTSDCTNKRCTLRSTYRKRANLSRTLFQHFLAFASFFYN